MDHSRFKLKKLLLSVAIVCWAIIGTSRTAQTEQLPAPSQQTASKLEIEQLKAEVARQKAQIEDLQRSLDDQKRLLEQLLRLSSTNGPTSTETSVASTVGATSSAKVDPVPQVVEPGDSTSSSQEPDSDKPLPMSFRIGRVKLTPSGFLDFTATIRSRNVGSGLATSFGNFPFNDVPAGRLSEFRFTSQNSRLGLIIDTKLFGSDLLGLVEVDFNGFSPGNIAVTTNSHNPRMRLFWLDLKRKKWELLVGQSWSLLTPNRIGLSPLPADIFSTLMIDPNLQVGLVWGRNPQFRAIYHASDTVHLGLSLEAPEQYGGGSTGAGEITFPSELAGSYRAQINTGESTVSVPNLHPDIVAKLAFEPRIGDKRVHFEFAGLLRSFKFFNPLDQRHYSARGGGLSAAFNYELAKNFRVLANAFYSDGGGRWILGLAPDLIVKTNGDPSLIHSASTVAGFESQVTPGDLFYGYYGGVYIQRNTAIDKNGEYVGYGYSGSPLDHNRSIQEVTVGYQRTLWRDPDYGALQFMTQFSRVVRQPWSVAPDDPNGTHLNMLYLNFRYLFPGGAYAFKSK